MSEPHSDYKERAAVVTTGRTYDPESGPNEFDANSEARNEKPPLGAGAFGFCFGFYFTVAYAKAPVLQKLKKYANEITVLIMIREYARLKESQE